VDAAIVRALLHHAARLSTPESAIVLRQVIEQQDAQRRREPLQPGPLAPPPALSAT
jgi:hypothetical protein